MEDGSWITVLGAFLTGGGFIALVGSHKDRHKASVDEKEAISKSRVELIELLTAQTKTISDRLLGVEKNHQERIDQVNTLQEQLQVEKLKVKRLEGEVSELKDLIARKENHWANYETANHNKQREHEKELCETRKSLNSVLELVRGYFGPNVPEMPLSDEIELYKVKFNEAK